MSRDRKGKGTEGRRGTEGKREGKEEWEVHTDTENITA